MKEVKCMYNFDKVIERRGTNCAKWDGPIADYNNENIIPMWVADMDFEVAEPIRNRIANRILHPVFGYARKDWDAFHAIVKHFNEKCNHTITCEDVILSTGVVYSFDAAVRLFSEVGDKIMIHAPAYPPFRGVPTGNGRIIVDTQMKIEDGKYVFDFEDMEAKVDGCKMFILCNPQNPTGRVFTKEELEQVAKFCEKHNLLVVCDEIHADLNLYGNEHTPIAKLNPNSITLMAPSKTFNIAGLQASLAIAENPEIMKKLTGQFLKQGFYGLNVLAYPAMEAAYTYGADWLKEAVSVIEDNVELVTSFINDKLPAVKVIKPEASFLVWIDLRELDITDSEITKRLIQKGRIALEPGAKFGKAGSGFVRMNIGCSPETVKEGLNRLYTAFDDLI